MGCGRRFLAMNGKRRWLGFPVWVIDADGKTHNGTLWWVDETSVLIRRNGRVGLLTLPKAAEWTRWGFRDKNYKTP
jgi:hypothetical protein